LFYRTVSMFVRNPAHLFMTGSLLIMFAAFICGSMSIYLLSRNSVLSLLFAALAVFSQALHVLPRVSFLAVAILGLGAPFALAFRRVCDKAAILAVVAFLLTFVRPEFIAALYALLAVAAGSSLYALWSWWRRGRDHKEAGFAEAAVPCLCLLAIVALTILWSLPIPSPQGRAFMAFGQHYSYRYVADHGLTENPWQNWTTIMTHEFPGATTVGSAFRLDPVKVLRFYESNLRDTISTIRKTVLSVLFAYPLFLVAGIALFLGAGITIPIGGTIWRSWTRSAGPGKLKSLLADIPLLATFAMPPLLACILIYPRDHYIILVEFAACLLVARLLRGWEPPLATGLTVGLGITFLMSIRPLPLVPQPTLQIVQKLRELPSIRHMLEDDGGWCFYLGPQCSAQIIPDIGSDEEVRALLDRDIVDAVLVSPLMRNYAKFHPMAGLDAFLNSSAPVGWTAVSLAPGYSIFYRPPSMSRADGPLERSIAPQS
jgi:hypothetical protein